MTGRAHCQRQVAFFYFFSSDISCKKTWPQKKFIFNIMKLLKLLRTTVARSHYNMNLNGIFFANYCYCVEVKQDSPKFWAMLLHWMTMLMNTPDVRSSALIYLSILELKCKLVCTLQNTSTPEPLFWIVSCLCYGVEASATMFFFSLVTQSW